MSDNLQFWANVSQVVALFITIAALTVALLAWLKPDARLSPTWFRVIRPFLPFIVIAAVFFWIGYWLSGREGEMQPIEVTRIVPVTQIVTVEVPITQLVTDTPLPSLSEGATTSVAPTEISSVSSPTSTFTPIPTETPFPQVFLDDFSDGLDPAWIPVSGKAVSVNGQLTASEVTVLYLGEPDWKDYQIEIDIESLGKDYGLNTAGNITNTPGNGIGVRASNMNNMITYGFVVNGGEWRYLINSGLSAVPNTYTDGWGSPPIHLVIKVEGNKFEAYNGSLLLSSFIDNDFQSGYVFLKIAPNAILDNFKMTLLNQ